MKWRLLKEEKPDPEKTLFVLSEMYGYQVDMIQRNAPNFPYRLNVPGVIWWIYTSEIEKPSETGQETEGLRG